MENEGAFKKLKEKEREFRKKMIIDAALSLFEKKTFNKTSMNDIATEVGVSTATLYSYFPNQESLFLEAFIRDLTYLDQVMKEEVEKKSRDNDYRAMETLADSMVNHLMTSQATFHMISLLLTEGSMPEHLLEKFDEIRREFNERVIRVLKLSGVENPDAKTSKAFFASVLGVIMIFRNYPEKDMTDPQENIRELVRHIVDIFKSSLTGS
jgi:AcrR family transcriptional regulator